ncbi:predicted protein [Nematostella vectensis]|uniref:Uncharacterized protein n=1 Tax=Nematostella vectensis TaxID=45351 RepID=A7S5A4_NEMVE|nr:uncharacterized protein LOC5512802 [Nematostella vectensis]EDO41054.1 predicted protein [Nematostella vectensis]|eukprot:XP_001633117.1 predicted protein [Nematostella vectensis]
MSSTSFTDIKYKRATQTNRREKLFLTDKLSNLDKKRSQAEKELKDIRNARRLVQGVTACRKSSLSSPNLLPEIPCRRKFLPSLDLNGNYLMPPSQGMRHSKSWDDIRCQSADGPQRKCASYLDLPDLAPSPPPGKLRDQRHVSSSESLVSGAAFSTQRPPYKQKSLNALNSNDHGWVMEKPRHTRRESLCSSTSDIGNTNLDIGSNTLNIGSNTQNIESNTQNFGSNTQNIGSNTQNIGSNTQNIGSNTQNIGSNTSHVSKTTPDIASTSNARKIGAVPEIVMSDYDFERRRTESSLDAHVRLVAVSRRRKSLASTLELGRMVRNEKGWMSQETTSKLKRIGQIDITKFKAATTHRVTRHAKNLQDDVTDCSSTTGNVGARTPPMKRATQFLFNTA